MAQSKFTRRHYRVIAGSVESALTHSKIAMSNVEYETARSAIAAFAHLVSQEFQKDNAKFDKDKFMTACGLTKGEAK